MSSTRAVRTSPGSIQNAENPNANPAQGSRGPQNYDPSLITVCVSSFTPRDTPIQWNLRYLARNGIRSGT